MKLVWGSVEAIERERAGLQRLLVTLDGSGAAAPAVAVCYPELNGRCEIGDRVLLNTTAVELGLGTGGAHFVVARTNQEPGHGVGTCCSGIALDDPSGGHVMKLRYAPLQRDVMSVEAPESPHHEVMAAATSVDGMPVVCCGLHSQVPLVAAAIKQASESLRVAYCMTDQAALALALSDVAAASVEVGLLDATVTCGQAFGGSIEAVTTHSGLLAARHVLGADVAIVAIGPGVAGTSTPFGHGGIAQGEAINAAAAVGGRPVACLRMSFADARERHRGVSHHSLAALGKIAMSSAVVPIPALSQELSDAIRKQLYEHGIGTAHRVVEPSPEELSPPLLRGIAVTTMGRGPAEDPAFFSAAYAAGDIASKIALGVLE